MKKSVAFILALCMMLLAGCGTATTADESAPKESLAAQTLDESSTPETVVVPDVVGMDKDEAVKKLEELGLKVIFTKEPARDTNLAKNIITTQSHAKDTVVVYGAEIELQYNSHEVKFEYGANDDGTICITDICGVPDNGILEIPAILDGKTVGDFGPPLLIPNGITEVVIPNGVTSIPEIQCYQKIKIKINNSKENVRIGYISEECDIIYLK